MCYLLRMRPPKLLCLGLGLLSSFVFACDNGTECGDGTVEVDGVCVAADTDASGESGGEESSGPSSTPAGATHGGDDAPNAGESESGGGGEPYQACPAESDVQCAASEGCVELTHVCASSCSEDTDCAGPSSGTSVQRCEDIEYDPGAGGSVCVLFCGGGLACPEGMSCESTSLLPSFDNVALEICVWN